MTSPENFGQQFDGYIPVFRGIPDVSSTTALRRRAVGKHWSASPKAAERFANRESGITLEHMNDGGNSWKGTVIAGYVHPNDIAEPGTPEHEDLIRSRDIKLEQNKGFNENLKPIQEDEVPIRNGATVHVVQTRDIRYTRGKSPEVKFNNLESPIPKVL